MTPRLTIALLVMSLLLPSVHAHRLFDSSGRFLGRLETERFDNAIGQPTGRVDGDRSYDGSGHPIGCVDGLRHPQILVFLDSFVRLPT